MPWGDKTINWKIAGAAGLGIKSTGEVMAKALSRSGLYINGYTEYPSLIRGGHNTYQVLASEKQVSNPRWNLDILVALNEEGVVLHEDEIDERTKIVVDESVKIEGNRGRLIQVPLLEKAKELGNPIVQNVIALGVSAALIGVEISIFEELIEEEFGKKKELLEINKKALRVGWELAGEERQVELRKRADKPRMVMSGSEAVAMGAMAAGMQLYCAYPMTPATPVMHFLAKYQDKYDLVVRQTEDEIAAVNMAIGASFAGVKAMTGTSGGGFALMQEGISLAGMLELPLVVMLAMRPGPATGLPTWSSQTDLRFAIHAGHGEFAKIVLAPGDPVEAYELSYKAFELAQKYQTVVILLTDKLLAESHYSVELLEEKPVVEVSNVTDKPKKPEEEMFHRYQPSANGVSERTLPGLVNGYYVANSDEHGPEGLVDESAEMREVMVRRRLLKLKSIESDMALPVIYGSKETKLSLVGFGSVKGVALEVIKEFNDVNYIHFNHVWPMPSKAREVLEGRKLVFLENNMTGQLEGLVREYLGLGGISNIRKDDGRPFYVDEVVNLVKRII
ncbi:2-oxoacid:acceptor oxidoreductase subunit alpha [Candidatus Chazhemtobacterium aquaticus]|nr:2-oxoacid:acceptor oxidoreductase subunit alpha [Candidatus Chazhemtobacterium aquaticus]